VTAWGMRRELVELCGGRHDGHQYRVEDLPERVEMPEPIAPSDGARLYGKVTWHNGPPPALVYRRTDVVREADGAWLYVLDGVQWRGFEVKPGD
jgi:hypothetical protein